MSTERLPQTNTMKKLFLPFFPVLVICFAPGCDKSPNEPSGSPGAQTTVPPDSSESGTAPCTAGESPPSPEGRFVVAYRDGVAETMSEKSAIRDGLTVVDLSNYWVPFIFSERDGSDEEPSPNTFRPVFQKLANDWPYESRTLEAARLAVESRAERHRRQRIEELRSEGLNEEQIRERLGLEDEEALKKETVAEELIEDGVGEEGHFLEAYGIPPSFSVLRKRALEEIDRPCFEEVDYERIARFDGFMSYKNKDAARAEQRDGRYFAKRMRDEMKRLKVTDPLSLIGHPKAKSSKALVEKAVAYEALVEAQKQLECEGLFPPKTTSYWTGALDWKTHKALSNFEHKNRIFGWGFFGRESSNALTKSPKERLYDAFVRVLAERIVDAAGIIEDGSAKDPGGEPATYVDTDGEQKPVPNLVAKFTSAALRHMNLGTPDKAVEFLKKFDDEDWKELLVALPMPDLPPYYSDEMQLSAVVDRGDVWYDYPYDEDGNRGYQPRDKMPELTLFVTWRDQEIPLMTTNTTIGGWRSEYAPDGYEYLAYKESDVGPRVWKDIVAGPVWLPPATTPPAGLLKTVRYKGQEVKVPNYDEMGPWYASAYGLVAAFHVRPDPGRNGAVDYRDNGIRSHGSVDYMSILRRFSHGCHRLYNHLAIRLFDFVLRHRPFVRVGQIPAGFGRTVTVDDEEFAIKLDTKGYKYELVSPVPVTTTKGNIRGKQQTPITTYMPKPGEKYTEEAQYLPEGYWDNHKDTGQEDTDSSSAPGDPTDTAASGQPSEDTASKPQAASSDAGDGAE